MKAVVSVGQSFESASLPPKYVICLLRYFTAVSEGARLTDSPPAVTLIGIEVTLSEGGPPGGLYDEAITPPSTSKLLSVVVIVEIIVVFAFCAVEKPMLRTTNAKAAATSTNAIKIIADSSPMRARWELFLCHF